LKAIDLAHKTNEVNAVCVCGCGPELFSDFIAAVQLPWGP